MIATIIGRGHSGTRLLSRLLNENGFYMGSKINSSGDKIPPDKLYESCKIFSRYVRYIGNNSWNFTQALECQIPNEFINLIKSYLQDVINSNYMLKGWKLPETTLIYPWIVRLYPDIRYIYIIRDPRDCIMKRHVTDDLKEFGIKYSISNNDEMYKRAISWLYQYEIIKKTPKPKFFYAIRFEDLIEHTEKICRDLSIFLGVKLDCPSVNIEAAYRYKKCESVQTFSFWKEALELYDYEYR